MRLPVFALITWLWACSAVAVVSTPPQYAACFAEAAARQRVPELLLVAIAWKESKFNHLAQHINSDRTEDVGLMQIHQSWFPKLAKFGIRREHLFQPCVSIHVGAWILANNFRQYGYHWRAVGAYNASRDYWKQARYAHAIWKEAGLL